MENEEIIKIDNTFDFIKVFKRNYCTLLNISVIKIEMETLFIVDNEPHSIKYPGSLYCVMYREWRNQTWFKIEDPAQRNNVFWSSKEKAEEWFVKNLKIFGLEILNEEEAFKTAKICLMEAENTQIFLSKK